MPPAITITLHQPTITPQITSSYRASGKTGAAPTKDISNTQKGSNNSITMENTVLTRRKIVLFGLTHLMLSAQSSLAFTPSPILPTISQTNTALEASRKGNRNPKFKQSIDTPSYTSRRRPQINDVMDSITSPPSFPHSVDPTDLPPGTVNEDPLAGFVETIVHAADMRKATDIVAMRVTRCTSLTNFIVVVSGTSRPQNQAIANSIMVDVEEKHDGKRCLGNVSSLFLLVLS
jgi:hypothetical protein